MLVGFFGGVGAAFLEYQKQNSEGNNNVQDVKVFTESSAAHKINNTNNLNAPENPISASTVRSEMLDEYKVDTRGNTPLPPPRY